MSAIEIPAQGIKTALTGVAVATKITAAQQPLSAWLDEQHDASWTIDEWQLKGCQKLSSDGSYELLSISLAIAWLREMSRAGTDVDSDNLDRIWAIVRQTIRSPGKSGMQFSATRSSQGFMAVPLCSLISDGRIQELWRFHCWLPDGQRGRDATKIHAHQSLGQSWILAGNSTDVRLQAAVVQTKEEATHATYEPIWTDNNNSTGREYKTHILSSTVAKTGGYVKARETDRATHHKNQSYTVPAGAYHESIMPGDQTHATLFVFDSSRGYQHDAFILGPVDGDRYTELRDSAGITALQLVEAADTLRYSTSCE